MTSRRNRLWLVVESSTDVRLVDGLAETFDLTVLARTVKGGVEVSQPPSVAVRVLRGGPSHAGFAWHVLTRLLAQSQQIDLVVVQNYGLAALATNLAGRLARTVTPGTWKKAGERLGMLSVRMNRSASTSSAFTFPRARI